MERMSVRVDQNLKRALEAEARERGVRPSDVVRQVLEEHVRRRAPRESCLDIARRIGIIGVFKDTPADLSTNPEHMEGFGRD
ncbi:MAG: CopG family transcriptional regulator [Isosphaeraceae bacterium]